MTDMRYVAIPANSRACTNILRVLPANDLKSSFEILLSRVNQCIEVEENYFE